MCQPHGAAPTPLLAPQPSPSPSQRLQQPSPWMPLWAPALRRGSDAPLAPCSSLPVMAVMVAGSLSLLPARLVMLMW